MYEQHFGLIKNPFSMTPEPAMVYMTPWHREALAGLAFAILERKGFVMLTGEAGTGKSTMLARTLHHLPTKRVVSSVILNPTLTESEFLELTMLDFGFESVPASKAQRLVQLQDFLFRTKQAGKIAVLAIDEAHKLPTAVFEEVRLLSNFELPGEKLLQIVLAGQDELLETLARTDLRQTSQRISVRLTLPPLAESDVEQYIAFRWSKCGGTMPPPFAQDAYAEIAKWSRGIPRLVNSICDNVLMAVLTEKPPIVQAEHVRDAARELSLLRNAAAVGVGQVGLGVTSANGVTNAKGVTNANGVARNSEPDQTHIHVPVAPIRVLDRYAEQKPARLVRWMTKLGLVRQGA